MFKKFAEFTPTTWGILAVLLIGGGILFAMTRTKKRWSAHMLANAALCIALSFILSYIRLYRMPQGGSITPASMLPLLLFSVAYGVGPGFTAGAAYGLLQFMQGGDFVHPVQMLLDYPLAFAMLGLAGLSQDNDSLLPLVLSILLGIFGRFLCAFLSGMVFWGIYAPEGQPVWLYSMVYNGIYLIPEAAICIGLALVPQIRGLAKTMRRMER